MLEILIHGRGGRGAVTLAKLIGTQYFLTGKQVQSFGLYGAERAGAPVQAYVRIDDRPVAVYGPITTPDHVIVLDSSLISPASCAGLRAHGKLLLNTPKTPEAFADTFEGRCVATVDADRIAIRHHLGSAAAPIVNTAMLGAAARLFGAPFTDVEAALTETGLIGKDVRAARAGYETVRWRRLPGRPQQLGPPSHTRVHHFFDLSIENHPTNHTGEWAIRQPSIRKMVAPCSHSCPAGNDVREFLHALAGDDYERALAVILATSPFPGTCGRVCPAPCMDGCNRGRLDEPVNVAALERAVADRAVWPEPVRPFRNENVGIVGGGPAGLTAAYHLARAGFRVSVFEAQSELGGLLRYGIPSYRLPLDVVDREVSHILAHGVEVHTGQKIDRERLTALEREYDAVLVATGQQIRRSLAVRGGASGQTVQGLDLLKDAKRKENSWAGLQVAVVGGGNTAIDAARTAVRLGAREVRVIYRRSEDQMRASAEEIRHAKQEGVRIEPCSLPVMFADEGGQSVLVCRAAGDGGPSGGEDLRPPQAAVAGERGFSIPCDRLILAVGQSADLSILPAACVPENGLVAYSDGTPIFAAGDLTGRGGTLAAAIGSGRAAAAHIWGALLGIESPGPEAGPVAGPDYVSVTRFPRSPQHRCSLLPVATRRTTFREVNLGYADEEGRVTAVAEADRCLSCGDCTDCRSCVFSCPEGVVCISDQSLPGFDHEQCKGCGICAQECPRGVIQMASLTGPR